MGKIIDDPEILNDILKLLVWNNSLIKTLLEFKVNEEQRATGKNKELIEREILALSLKQQEVTWKRLNRHGKISCDPLFAP